MLPIKSIRLALGELLAADIPTLAPATANKIALVIANFVPTETLVVGDLTLADFDGATPIAGATGAQQAGVDPATGEQLVTIKPPAGGYRWETTGVTNLPQTVYGYALLDNAGTGLLATALLPTPVTLDAVGQEINIGEVTIAINPTPFV